MNKKKVPILVGIFLLVHVTASSLGFSEVTCPLSPQTKVSSNNSDVAFKQLYDTIYIAISIYKSDALGRFTKGELMRRFNAALFNREVRFDLEHIDINKKGWTRYYQVYIGEKQFIVRIFLTEEKSYQYDAKVLL